MIDNIAIKLMMDSKPGIALVTGATGTIGPSLVKYLIEKGFLVRVLLQKETGSGKLPEVVDRYIGDITNQDIVEKAVNGADYVFHLAAKLHINDPDPSLKTEYERVNIDGTRTIVDASIAANVTRLIFFSTINVYGPGKQEQQFDEDSPLDPQSYYEMTKAEAEKIVFRAKSHTEGKPLGVVLRLAAVYGPTMKGNYLSLLKGLKQGWFIPIGTGINKRTLIYVDDAVQAAVLAALNPVAAGKIYNLTDGRTYSLQDIIRGMCKALRREPPQIHLPSSFVRFSFGLVEDIFGVFGMHTALGRHTIDGMLEDRAVNGDKIQEELGFQARVGLEDGWSRTVNELFNHIDE